MALPKNPCEGPGIGHCPPHGWAANHPDNRVPVAPPVVGVAVVAPVEEASLEVPAEQPKKGKK